jgi:hypothetical protein
MISHTREKRHEKDCVLWQSQQSGLKQPEEFEDDNNYSNYIEDASVHVED